MKRWVKWTAVAGVLGAAALLMSVEAARKLVVPEAKWVYLRGHADMKEQKLLGRPDIGASPASVLAVEEGADCEAQSETVAASTGLPAESRTVPRAPE